MWYDVLNNLLDKKPCSILATSSCDSRMHWSHCRSLTLLWETIGLNIHSTHKFTFKFEADSRNGTNIPEYSWLDWSMVCLSLCYPLTKTRYFSSGWQRCAPMEIQCKWQKKLVRIGKKRILMGEWKQMTYHSNGWSWQSLICSRREFSNNIMNKRSKQ
jgi:hypothetical protein